MLTGRHLSPIQTEAVKVRIMQTTQREQQQRIDSVKLALLSNDPSNLSLLFPDMFPPTPMTDKELDEALSGSGPLIIESIPMSEVQDVLAMLGGEGFLSGEDLSFDFGGE